MLFRLKEPLTAEEAMEFLNSDGVWRYEATEDRVWLRWRNWDAWMDRKEFDRIGPFWKSPLAQ